jgi:hypothetical protein
MVDTPKSQQDSKSNPTQKPHKKSEMDVVILCGHFSQAIFAQTGFKERYESTATPAETAADRAAQDRNYVFLTSKKNQLLRLFNEGGRSGVDLVNFLDIVESDPRYQRNMFELVEIFANVTQRIAQTQPELYDLLSDELKSADVIDMLERKGCTAMARICRHT